MNSTKTVKNYILANEAETIAMGRAIAQCVSKVLKKGIVVYLYGDLGAGKTTLTRGFVQAMGHQGNVKSPTYTLVEPYDLGQWQLYHFDLYRLSDPEELEYMGIRDYFNDNSCSFIEWPDKGKGMIAKADIVIDIAYQAQQRGVIITAKTEVGYELLKNLTI